MKKWKYIKDKCATLVQQYQNKPNPSIGFPARIHTSEILNQFFGTEICPECGQPKKQLHTPLLKKETLHNQFYDFRDEVWRQFEALVRTGCHFIGELSIITGEINLPGPKIIANTQEIIIYGIIRDENYNLRQDDDLIMGTAKIKVRRQEGAETFLEDVEPNILDLQSLCTYVSGGYAAYG